MELLVREAEGVRHEGLGVQGWGEAGTQIIILCKKVLSGLGTAWREETAPAKGPTEPKRLGEEGA